MLTWRKATGELRLSVDGVPLLAESVTGFASFARVYFKGNGAVCLDDVRVESGYVTEPAIRLLETFNSRSGALEPRWRRLSGTAAIVDEDGEKVMAPADHGTRYHAEVGSLGTAADYPLVNVSFTARRTAPYGNSGGFFLVDENGSGLGFLAELADESFQRTTLQVATTTNAGQTWTVIAHKEFPGIAGQQMHRIGFTWDRVAGTVRGAIDDAPPQTVAPSGATLSGSVRHGVLVGQFAPTLRLDQLLVTRVPSTAAIATSHGVIGDGMTDNQASLQSLFAAAKAAGVPVFLPLGIYVHSGTLVADGIDVIGAGLVSTLRATAAPSGTQKSDALILRGSGGSVVGCRFVSAHGTVRGENRASSGILAEGAADFSIAGNRIEESVGAGIFLYEASARGRIFGNVVMRTRADGIHLTDNARDLSVFDNIVLGNGDDYISVVSYHATLCENIDIFGNRAKGQTLGRGLSVVGGRSVMIGGNDLENSDGAGLYAASEASYETNRTEDVWMMDNVVRQASLGEPSHAAVLVSGRPGYPVSRVRIEGNRILNATGHAVSLLQYAEETSVVANTMEDAGGIGILVAGAKDSRLAGNTLLRIGKYGVYAGNAATNGYLRVTGNSFSDIHTSGTESYIDVINIGAETSLSDVSLLNNVFSNPNSRPIERFIENWESAVSVTSGNTSTPFTGSFP